MFRRFRRNVNSAATCILPADRAVAALDPNGDVLLQVTGPEDGACVCNDWVGAVISLHGGSTDLPSLTRAVADGLFHSGCRHSVRVYDASALNSKEQSEATFCTRLALDTLKRRELAQEPGSQERFTRLYGWARRVDKAGSPAVAALFCEAALEIIRSDDVFGPSQADLERILKSRIATIRARL